MTDTATREPLGPVISFRLPQPKHQEYLAAAMASGVSLSRVVRECLAVASPTLVVGEGSQRRALSVEEMERMAAAAGKVKKAKKEATSEEKKRLIYLFNKASNNINQLAFRANSDNASGVISDKTYASILNELQRLNQYLKANARDVD